MLRTVFAFLVTELENKVCDYDAFPKRFLAEMSPVLDWMSPVLGCMSPVLDWMSSKLDWMSPVSDSVFGFEV